MITQLNEINMFDRIDRSDRSTKIEFPDTIKVHEHKAPTDESIRLYEEFKLKALDSIVRSFKIESNILNAHVIAIAEDPCLDKVRVVIRFNINGQDFKTEAFVERFNIYQKYDQWKIYNSSGPITLDQYMVAEYCKIITLFLLKESKLKVGLSVSEYMLNNINNKDPEYKKLFTDNQ